MGILIPQRPIRTDLYCVTCNLPMRWDGISEGNLFIHTCPKCKETDKRPVKYPLDEWITEIS